MDKNKEAIQVLNHNIQINERKNIVINGIKKIENFDNEEFFLESVMGYILIKGEDLDLIKLDTYQGIITIKGKLNSLNYFDEENKKMKKENLFSKLFK